MTQVDEEMTKKKDTEAPQINALMYLFFLHYLRIFPVMFYLKTI